MGVSTGAIESYISSSIGSLVIGNEVGVACCVGVVFFGVVFDLLGLLYSGDCGSRLS